MSDHLTRAVALVLCRSGRFETGQGTCALICMDQLGNPRKTGCRHACQVHGKLAQEVREGYEETVRRAGSI